MGTVAVCDQHLLFAEAFAEVLRGQGERAVVIPHPPDIMATLGDTSITSVVLDVGFPHASAFLAARRIRAARPDIYLVCLAEEPCDQRACVESGATLILSKKQPLSELVQAALRPWSLKPGQVGARRSHPSGWRPRPQPSKDQPLPVQFLTKRERDVLTLLATAESTSGIAKRLGISVTTARGYIQSTFMKLGVHSRVEAVTYAMRHEVVEF